MRAMLAGLQRVIPLLVNVQPAGAVPLYHFLSADYAITDAFIAG